MIEEEGSGVKVLHFLLHDVRCCLELRYVEKILPLPSLEHVPGCPVYFVGLMNLRNTCIPVFDLAMCTGLTRNQIYPLNIPILLCSDGNHQIGLIVDKVIGLGEIVMEKIEIHDELAKGSSPFYGAVTLETGVSLVMNIPWIFSLKLVQEEQQDSTSHE